jgi:hypothetical protein
VQEKYASTLHTLKSNQKKRKKQEEQRKKNYTTPEKKTILSPSNKTPSLENKNISFFFDFLVKYFLVKISDWFKLQMHITDLRDEAKKWILDYESNINGFEILKVVDNTFYLTIAEVFNFMIQVNEENFSIELEEDDEYILDDFKQVNFLFLKTRL